MIDNSFEIGDKVVIKADIIGVHSELRTLKTGEKRKILYYDIQSDNNKFRMYRIPENVLELDARD